MPLLVGLGVEELSVGASRVGTVRAWVRELVLSEAQDLATRALGCTTAEGSRRSWLRWPSGWLPSSEGTRPSGGAGPEAGPQIASAADVLAEHLELGACTNVPWAEAVSQSVAFSGSLSCSPW